jgi:molybdopterin-containing oxidoreductase family iron-sulfur binding subunit
MKKQVNNVWLGTDQLEGSAEYLKATDNEIGSPMMDAADDSRLESSRRDFLKYLGFGVTAATIASCDIPVRKAIPYVSKPDTIVPGVATYFASTFVQGGDYVPVLVKTREGRPIKIEGNSSCHMTGGGTSARSQASILGVYDTSRFDGPYRIGNGMAKAGEKPDWDVIDTEIKGKLSAGAKVRIVSHTEMSPSLMMAIADFKAKYTNTEHVMYDPVSASALLDANEASFGRRAVPSYHFDKADVIVSIDADFLGTWISPVQFAKDYIKGRQTNAKKMSRHVQIESNMSMTGSNADNRILVKPSEQGQAILALYNAVVGGGAAASLDAETTKKINAVATELKRNRTRGLVVSGSNNLGEQLLVNAINDAIGAYGNTISTLRWSNQRKGSDQALANLAKELESGSVDALIVLDGANPAYDNAFATKFAENISKAKVSISMSGLPNETTMLCQYVAPTHHYLESWSDVMPVDGHISLIQPAITPIFASVGRAGTRQQGESFLVWSDAAAYDAKADQPYLEYVKGVWQKTAFVAQNEYVGFRSFWDSSLQAGVITLPAGGSEFAFNAAAAGNAAGKVSKPGSGQEVSFFETINIGNGVYAGNPWLQEVPDPVTRTVWGNYLSIPVRWDGGNSYTAYEDLNKEEYKGKADIVTLTANGADINVTAVRQFGQKPETFGLALGYGRTVTGVSGRAIGHDIGVDVYPMLSVDSEGYVQYYATGAEVSGAVDREPEFASVQYHHSMGLTMKDDSGKMAYYNRRTGDIVYEAPTTDAEKEYIKPYNVDEKTVMEIGEGMQGGLVDRSIIYSGKFAELGDLTSHIKHNRDHAKHLNDQTLYPYEEYKEEVYSQGHWWAMHVDLTACIGCAACEVACVAENNVPIVGKYEVFRHHEMKWLRIDRYFYGDIENPRAVYQPMMCQHCDNAPCENVCPVNASQHSDEGLNQMVYNRCIGTRYCANNCPYKVRRFNWLDYTTGDLFSSNEPTVQGEELAFGADNLTRMVLNPDVTVRSRGVIEKCSFCTQRLQEGKLQAKVEKRALRDSDVRTACQTACPTGAITFGDRNTKGGDVSTKLENPLNYLALEEVNTQSGVFYAARVHNPLEELEA